jgi:hypothetical protein
LSEGPIVEENTRNITTVNHFTRLRVESFPSPPQRFTVYSVLTDGLGEVGLVLRVVRLDTLEDVYYRSWSMAFRDPLDQVRLVLRVSACSLPVAGRYQVTLEADEDLIAQCVLTVSSLENSL